MARVEQSFVTPSLLSGPWDVHRIREDFPVLRQTVNGKPLIYLDNAASSQVPQVVIDRGSVYSSKSIQTFIEAFTISVRKPPLLTRAREKRCGGLSMHEMSKNASSCGAPPKA